MKLLLTGCLLLLVSAVVQAQINPFKKRSVDVSVGWEKFTFLDQHASPLTYSTNSIFPKIGVSFTRQTANSSYELGLSGTIGNLNPTRFGQRTYGTKISETDSFKYNVASRFYNVNIHAAYFRNIKSLSSDKANYWIGGILDESAYYGDAIANMPWMLNYVDLSPAFKVNYAPLTQHTFGVKMDFAIFGLLTRMTYSLFPKSSKNNNVVSYLKDGTRMASLNRFQKVNLRFTYQYQASKHFAVGAGYRMKYLHYSYPKTLKATDNNFDFTFSYTY